MPPAKDDICDNCGGGLVRRNDDNPDVIRKRWQVFFNESQQILDFYQNKGKLVNIDGRGDKNEIFERVKEKLQ